MKLKWICLLLLAAMTLSLFACGGGTPPANQESGSGTESGETLDKTAIPEEIMILGANGVSDYQIVYSIGNTEAKAQAEALAAYLLQVTGVSIPVVHDSQRESEYEIVLGDASRYIKVDGKTTSIAGKHGLGNSDFAIEVLGNRVYIAAQTPKTLCSAVDYFINKVAYTNKYAFAAGVASDCKIVYKASGATATAVSGSDESYLWFSLGAGSLMETFCQLSFTGEGGWRIQTKHNASDIFDNVGASQLLSLSLGEAPHATLKPIEVAEKGDNVTVKEAGGSYAVLSKKNFKLEFYSPTGKLVATVTNIASDAAGSRIEGQLETGEGIYGTGERFNSANQAGKYIEVFSSDMWSQSNACYMEIPMLCSSRGAGIFLNRYGYMTLDLGLSNKNKWVAEISDAEMDCYIMATDRISDALLGYTELSGHADQPEEWTYGMIVCRYAQDLTRKWSVDITPVKDNRHNGVYDTIAMMEKYDLPWTGILAEGWGINRNRQELKELCDYVHSLGKKFLLYIPMGQNGTGYDVKQITPYGSVYNIPETESGVINPDRGEDAEYRKYIDITNPLAVEWYLEEYWEELLTEVGVDGVKVDFCEQMPEDYPYDYYNDYSTNIANKGTHHWYPTAFNALLYSAVGSKPDGGMLYIRGGGIGLQRSPYVWGGDQKREYNSIKYQLIGALSSGMSGLPYFSYDMSGYQYHYSYMATEEQYMADPTRNIATEATVFLRGLQYSAFTVCMQMHGQVRNPFDFAEYTQYFVNGQETRIFYDAKEKRTYVYAALDGDVDGAEKPLKKNYLIYQDADGKDYVEKNGKKYYVEARKNDNYVYVTDIYRAYVKLHELLTPYITEHAAIASSTGMPLMRHMVLHWQDDSNVYTIDDQYMFGDAFLVAPVLNDMTSRDVYLPEGKWQDMNTGEIITVGKDGQWLNSYAASIGTLPLFYNMNSTSETAEGLIGGIREIFDYIKTIEP